MNKYDEFFKLYGAFLFIDAKYALIKGRERIIIKEFLTWYYHIRKTDKTKTQKEKILNMIMSYYRDCELDKPNLKIKINRSTIPKEAKDIQEASDVFRIALTTYIQWRQTLKEKALIIARHNTLDRLEYYFNLSNEEKNRIIQIIGKPKEYTEGNIIIPKQFLMEFHNAISHLFEIYCQGGKRENILRACNHFKRGALDLYKIIIKDFFILQNTNKTIQNELFQIRNQEYKLIGNDEKQNLFDSYKKIAIKCIQDIK